MVHHGPVVVRTEGRRGATACSPELGLRPLWSTGAHRRGSKREREHREPVSGLTGAQAVVWQSDNGEEAVAEVKHSGSGA
jgi:hypothetical protein